MQGPVLLIMLYYNKLFFFNEFLDMLQSKRETTSPSLAHIKFVHTNHSWRMAGIYGENFEKDPTRNVVNQWYIFLGAYLSHWEITRIGVPQLFDMILLEACEGGKQKWKLEQNKQIRQNVQI